MYFAQLECVKSRTPSDLAVTARRLLEREARVDPRVRFDKMVESGLIDREGRLTKLFGGDADPTPPVAPKPVDSGS